MPIFLERDLKPVDLFELFFDDGVVAQIVDYSGKYANSSSNQLFQLSPDKLRLSKALLLLRCYAVLPRGRMYWENRKMYRMQYFLVQCPVTILKKYFAITTDVS